MRIKLKHFPIRNIFRRLRLHRTDAKCDVEGSLTDDSIPQPLAGISKTAGIESEFERAPLSTPDRNTGPTTVPSTTITTAHEHLGIYPLGHPVALSQVSLPAITIIDPDGNRKAATSLQEPSAPEAPSAFGRDESEVSSKRLYASDSVQEAVNSALPKALQSSDLVSGLVNQIMVALVPVLDERIKVTLDSRAPGTESNDLHLDPIPEEPEQLSPLDLLLDRKLGISDTKLQSVKEPTPNSPTHTFGGDPLLRTSARRGNPREKSARHLDPLKAPSSPPKTPAKYPGNLPTPESHRGNWSHLPAGGHVNTQAFWTPTRRASSGKLSAEHLVEPVITVSSNTGPQSETPSDTSKTGRSLLWATEAPALPQGEPGPSGAATGTQDVFTAAQELPVSVLPPARSKSTGTVAKVPTTDDQPFAGLSMPQMSAPRPADETLRPTSSSPPDHSPSRSSDHGATHGSAGSLVDNSLLRDPAIVSIGSRLIGGYPPPSGDRAGDREDPTGYVRTPPEGEGHFSATVPARTDSAPVLPLDEHRVDPLPVPRTLFDSRTHSLEWIGGGASGEVYRVTNDRAPHVRFALKFVPLYLGNTRGAAVLEARALLKIKSANMYSEGARHVLRMFQDSVPEASDTGHAVFKMPYYKNTLHDYTQMLDRASLLFVTAEVTKRLQFLHSLRIIHLDVKPSNIFIDDEGHCVIGDFSGSYMGPLPKLAKKQVSTMTPEFMAPELSTGHSYRPSAKFDERADTWCLGVTIYILICGHRAIKMLGDDRPDFTDYDNIGLSKDTMLRLMGVASCSETVQKLVLEMCQIDQKLRWNTAMIQRYLEERDCWKWDDLSPLRKYSLYPVSSRPDFLGRGLIAPADISPEALRACCDTYLREIQE